MMSMQKYDVRPKTLDEAVDQLVLANRVLANQGVADAFGHVSLRHPENPEMFLQSRPLSPEFVTRDDILKLDMDGKVLSRSDCQPCDERMMHAAILKARPDVNAVFHGHPRSVIPFTCVDAPIRTIVHFGSMLYGGIPLYDDHDVSSGMLISSREEAERVARVLGGARALLMRGHGCVVVGENIATLVMASVYLRDNAAIQLKAMSLGEPRYLSFEHGAKANSAASSHLSVERAWNYWVRRAKAAMPDLD